MTDRHTADSITDDALDALYERLDAAEESESQRQLATAREALASATTRAARAEHELTALRKVARGYCPHCGRGDAAPTVADWERERQRADRAEAEIAACRKQQWPQQLAHAEAALARVRATCDHLHRASVLADGQPHTDREHRIVQAVARILAALDEPAPTAATQATDRQEQP